MFTVPPDTPVTIPVPDPTVAMDVLLLLHVPPVSGLAKVVIAPTQTVLEPVIAGAGGHHLNISPLVGLIELLCLHVEELAVPAVVAAQLVVVVLLL